MSEMFQIIALMAVPVAVLLGLRRVVTCQNRRLDAQACAVPLAGAEHPECMGLQRRYG